MLYALVLLQARRSEILTELVFFAKRAGRDREGVGNTVSRILVR